MFADLCILVWEVCVSIMKSFSYVFFWIGLEERMVGRMWDLRSRMKHGLRTVNEDFLVDFVYDTFDVRLGTDKVTNVMHLTRGCVRSGRIVSVDTVQDKDLEYVESLDVSALGILHYSSHFPA